VLDVVVDRLGTVVVVDVVMVVVVGGAVVGDTPAGTVVTGRRSSYRLDPLRYQSGSTEIGTCATVGGAGRVVVVVAVVVDGTAGVRPTNHTTPRITTARTLAPMPTRSRGGRSVTA